MLALLLVLAIGGPQAPKSVTVVDAATSRGVGGVQVFSASNATAPLGQSDASGTVNVDSLHCKTNEALTLHVPSSRFVDRSVSCQELVGLEGRTVALQNFEAALSGRWTLDLQKTLIMNPGSTLSTKDDNRNTGVPEYRIKHDSDSIMLSHVVNGAVTKTTCRLDGKGPLPSPNAERASTDQLGQAVWDGKVLKVIRAGAPDQTFSVTNGVLRVTTTARLPGQKTDSIRVSFYTSR